MEKNIRQTFGFIFTSLSSTGLELAAYTVLNHLLENLFPFFHIVISSSVSRCISEFVKFDLDRKAVFHSNDSSLLRYIIFACVKALMSISLISGIYYVTMGNRTLIKIMVDMCLFFPSFLISRTWIHHAS